MAAAVCSAAMPVVEGGHGGGGGGGSGANLPLSRLSRYSAACNKAAMLIFVTAMSTVGEKNNIRKMTRYQRTRSSHVRAYVGVGGTLPSLDAHGQENNVRPIENNVLSLRRRFNGNRANI